ncbi:uncharacterized protein BDR25DRAFT_338348 [Lindgomyces ingoldianus]|uniref:Uncharacterized protein n=1 Tax=Lindgomyces ingoldianus TaxID=673940 RepID=A0ACB6RG84_9PLEO|nr:uncharacterized protein BDR25DRAFT_338348 [Lindgomyces ingoldianus]KAF2477507.1 hypothetical protein BDR25DRAFT_338348 [Lindgomyces ingoldianus]
MEKKQTFQRLKQSCVELVQVVANLSQKPTAKKETIQCLVHLLKALQEVTAKPSSLDPKLAEYAFLPISHVLRASQIVPVHALELCLECISILLKEGWKADLSTELFAQLLILFTFLANPSSAENGIPATSEELQAAAFKCMTELLAQVSSTQEGKRSLMTTANVPAIGKAVLVMLDNVALNASNDVRLQAVAALKKLILAIDDRDTLSSFLPRIVSSLTKVLTPSSDNRASFRLLEQGLEALSTLLLRVLSDQETKTLPLEPPEGSARGGEKFLRTTSWLQATAAQIKIALSNVIKLRHHSKKEVRNALLQLCLGISQDCRTSLSGCLAMTIETLVTLAGRSGEDYIESDIRTLVYSDLKLTEILRESLHGWIISLPRMMQSKDDMGRRHIIHQVSVALRLLNREQIDLNRIDDLLAENLRDGLINVFKDSSRISSLAAPATDMILDTSLLLPEAPSTSFHSLQLQSKGQDDTMAEFQLLLQQIAKTDSSLTVGQDLVGFIQSGQDNMRLASFWLSTNLLREMTRYNAAVDDFLDFGTPSPRESLLDELYSFSLATLTNPDRDSNLHWHFQALALEVVAMQAIQSKEDFRVELIEALYPVLHLLGAPNPALRNHAITCLNLIAESCGYSSSSDLIISNVDYIVNAVGLKLNYHDISPQAPQVLLMMMRLCGPSLLPYLDDLVSSMFSALERFHGYPKLVELLFAVLKGMAEEGVKTPQLMIEPGTETLHQKRPWAATSMSEVAEFMNIMKLGATKPDEEHRTDGTPEFPKRPWKDEAGETIHNETIDESDRLENEAVEAAEPPPPASRTFEIILKISELTQYYLTSSSPTLRSSLLSLLHTTIPALAKHENSFLPLINTIWPVLLARLEDPEGYVVSNALDIVGLMCTYAGDFMKGRIEGMWEDLKAIQRRTVKATENRSERRNNTNSMPFSVPEETAVLTTDSEFRPADMEFYVDVPTRLIWNSMVLLLCSIAEHVAVREEVFDDMLDVLDPVLESSIVRKALEGRNSDAVWLRQSKKGNPPGSIPDTRATWPKKTSLLTGKPRWNFVQSRFQ